MSEELANFFEEHMQKGKRIIPARLQAALALLERVREFPSFSLDDHLVRGKAAIRSHESYGDKAHERWSISHAINKTHGRRSSELPSWGPLLLKLSADLGCEDSDARIRDERITFVQAPFAQRLIHLLEQEPMTVRLRGKSAEFVVAELLKQAELKGKAGDVAQYLVGAKLRLRFLDEKRVEPVNKGDRRSWIDMDARAGDFEIHDSVIEVALGLPDEKHVNQVALALEDSSAEVWILTKAERVSTWKKELSATEDLDIRRVVIMSVEAFVGQNVTELGEFSTKEKTLRLRELFDIYNRDWIDHLGQPGIRVVVR